MLIIFCRWRTFCWR